MNPPKKEASLVLRAGVIAGVVFSIALVGASFLLPIVYPKVSGDVLSLAFWGLIIMGCVQPAKVLNSVLGTGILPTGGDTKFVLFSHVISSYALGLPVAWICGVVARLGAWTVFGSRALEGKSSHAGPPISDLFVAPEVGNLVDSLMLFPISHSTCVRQRTVETSASVDAAGAGSTGQQVLLTVGQEKPTRCDSLSPRRISAESGTVRLEHQLTRRLNRLEPCFVHRR